MRGARPESGRGTSPQHAHLWGRDVQHQMLLSVLLGFDEVSSPGALLVGESGTGKTALLHALDAGVPGLLHVGARIGDKLVPYATLSRWMRLLLAQLPGEPDDEVRRGLAALLPDRWPEGAEGRGPPDVELVHRLLGMAQPDLGGWVLDDLHLADDASAEWLLRLLLQAPPSAMPWVIASQPPEAGSVVEGVLEAVAGMAGVQSVLLGPLDRPSLVAWLDEREPGVPHDVLSVRLLQATGGLPLHLRLLLDDPQTATVLSSDAEVPVPGVAQLIGQRLSRLSPSALAVARAAAVGGQDTTDAAVLDFTGLTPAELEAALAEMRAQDLWARDGFVHPRMREAARQALPDALARNLHAHFARWLESHDGQPARIAAHWQAAGQPARALPALQDAARRAQRLLCMAERMACLMRAATIAEEHQQLDLAFDCCCEAFEAHTESVRHTEGTQLLAQMKRLARTPRQQARAMAQATWHAMVHGHLDAAVEIGEQAVALAEAEGDETLIAPAQQYLGTALGVSGQLGRALPLLRAAEPWATRQLPPPEQASFHGNLAAVLDNLGRADEARRHHLSALSLASRHSDARHRATLLSNYALSRLEAGDPIGARELANKAQSLIEDREAEGSTAGFVAILMAPCERTLGRYIAALDWCDRAEHILAARNPTRMPVAHLQRAHVWMDLGLHERARELLAGPGLPLGRQLPARHAVRWLLLLARAQARLGDDPRPTLAEAHERLPAEGWPELALLLRSEEALVLPGAEAAQALCDVAQQAAAQGLSSVAVGAWLQCALLAAAGAREPALARHAAETALAALAKGVESVHVDRALRWLAPARALAACGESTRARGLLMRGQHWLQTTLAEQVPPMAQQSFLEGHPLNLLLRETPVPSA